MSKFKPKIGWQKYEDVIEKQITSPLLSNILTNIFHNRAMSSGVDELESEELDDDILGQDDADLSKHMPLVFPMSQKLLEDIGVISNFDCWVGHTNFDITPKIREKLNLIPGVELLKIFSRYRFFIGVGNMFDFGEVRKSIEKELLN
jgi:hypothetical protein